MVAQCGGFEAEQLLDGKTTLWRSREAVDRWQKTARVAIKEGAVGVIGY